MKAAFINRHGEPEVLQYGDLPDPVAGPGQVVVDIFAASVNAADWKSRSGDYGQVKFPYVLGRDFSGVVTAVGPGVDDLRIGDEVFAVCEAGQEGAYAEKIAIKAAIVAKKPTSLSHIEATAVALTGLTALSAIEDTLKLKPGETILIQGGAGGVAGLPFNSPSISAPARSPLRARPITPTCAVSAPMRSSTTTNACDFTKVVSNCDAVFDTVDGDVAQRSFAVLKPGGRAAFIASNAQAPQPARGDVTSLRPPVGRARAPLERIAQLVLQGAVRPPEIKLYRLSQAAEAHRVSESRHFRGKLVFQVR